MKGTFVLFWSEYVNHWSSLSWILAKTSDTINSRMKTMQVPLVDYCRRNKPKAL